MTTPEPASPDRGGRPRRTLLKAAGLFFTLLALLGVLLPVLPTTPFLLLAAWCFARSSPRLYAWLHNNRLFGDYLRRYRSGEGLPLPVKVTTISLLWLTLGASAVCTWPARPWLAGALALVGAAVTIHIARIKARSDRCGL
ncbi:MAG: YbaN family protein [Elusimicrobiales bacterium]